MGGGRRDAGGRTGCGITPALPLTCTVFFARITPRAALYCGTVGDSNACGQGITRGGGSD